MLPVSLAGDKKATKNMHHPKMNIGISLSRLGSALFHY